LAEGPALEFAAWLALSLLLVVQAVASSAIIAVAATAAIRLVVTIARTSPPTLAFVAKTSQQ
jgi:hypothetical protein